MILPNSADLKDLKKYPLTLTLVALNLVIFMMIFSGVRESFPTSKLLKDEGLELTGRLYYQYLKESTPAELAKKPAWILKMSSLNEEHMLVMGAYALRDSQFLTMAETSFFRGDEVQIASWKKQVSQFHVDYKDHLLFRFGLSSLEKNSMSWLTYQFSHSNWFHLASNLAFLVVVGAAVEVLAGSGVLLFIYLMGGFAGGLGFLLSNVHGTVPMVGASASISALLAFYCVAELRGRVRYFYFLSPLAGHFGSIYLPTLLILPLFLLVDLASFWSTPEGLGGGVAYTAHLGGTLLGLTAGLVYRWTSRRFVVPL